MGTPNGGDHVRTGAPVTRAGGISWRMCSTCKSDFGDLSCHYGATEEASGQLSKHQAGGHGSLAWENLLGCGCKGRAVLPSVQGQVLSLCQTFDLGFAPAVGCPPSVNPPGSLTLNNNQWWPRRDPATSFCFSARCSHFCRFFFFPVDIPYGISGKITALSRTDTPPPPFPSQA